MGCVLCMQGAVKDKDVPVEGVHFFLSGHDSQQVGLSIWKHLVMCVHVWSVHIRKRLQSVYIVCIHFMLIRKD